MTKFSVGVKEIARIERDSYTENIPEGCDRDNTIKTRIALCRTFEKRGAHGSFPSILVYGVVGTYRTFENRVSLRKFLDQSGTGY